MEPVKYSAWILERIAIGEVIRLRIGKNTVGRLPTSTVKVNSSFSSRCHCQLIVSSDATINLQDFSSNGTFVNNEQYKNSTVLLSDGDRIGIGCNVTDEQCMEEIYVMYNLRYRPLVVEPSKSNVLSEQVPKVKKTGSNIQPVESSNTALRFENNTSNNESKKVLNKVEEVIPKSSIATLKDVDKHKNENDHCEIDRTNTNNGKDGEIKTAECSSAKNKISSSTAQAETIARILEIIDLSSDVECEDDVSTKIKIANSPTAENTSTDRPQVFDFLRNSEENGPGTTKCDQKRKLSVSSKTQNKRRRSSGNEKLIEKSTENNSNNKKIYKRKSHDGQTQSCKNRRKSCVSEIAHSSDSRENNNNESYLTGSCSSKEIVIEKRRISFLSDKRRKSNRDKSPPMGSHMKEKSENSGDLNLKEAKRMSLIATSSGNSKISTDNAKNAEQQSCEEINKSNNDKMADNKISENNLVKSAMAIDDDDLVELEDIIDKLQSDLNESVDNEVYEISDDEEMNIHISQSFIRDIKKEYVDLELEEDVNTEALPETVEDTNKISAAENDNAEPLIKVESPMFEDDDDSDDDYDDTVTNWVLKLSQSMFSDSKLDSNDDVDSAFDDLVKKKYDKISEEIEEKIDYKTSDADRSGRTPKALPENAAVKKIEKIRPPIPEVIEPPSLPTKRGKLRGVSAQSASNSSYKTYLNKRCHKIRAKAKRNDLVKELEDKWRQKPNIDKAKQKADLLKLQEQRKIRLKELADVQANKRKLNDDDEVKIVKTPKVKITHKNRGAFLTEEPNPEKPMPATAHDRIKLGKIPKRQLSVHEKELNDNIQKSILGERSENKLSEENTSSIDDNLHNRVDTITALKIKTRTARTSSSVLHHDEKVAEAAVSKQSRNDSSLHQFESVQKETISNEKNTVHVESAIINASLKSVLKSLNNLKANVRSAQKKVQFKENHEIRYFQIENDRSLGRKVDTKDIAVDFTPFVEKTPLYRRKIPPVVDHTEMTLSDMLSWKPRWFDTHTEEVNGPGHVLLPMLQMFLSFEDFAKVVFPLMKLEVWAMIEKEYQLKMKCPSMVFKIESRHVESRHGKPRMVFYIEHCINVKTAPLYSGEFGEAKLEFQKNGMRLFAIISNIRKSNPNSKSYHITLETSYNLTNKDIYENAKEIRFSPITQIKVELGAFNAVHHLKQSPLSKLILNPMELIKLEEPVVDKVRYKGCDQMNDNQRNALLKTYCKIIDRNVSNICLIEGPPGTGKSRVITNLAMQILYGDKAKCLDRKILICAQSNTAIDVIALKLLEIRGKMERNKFKLVRFGILERMHKQVQSISVQKLIDGNKKPKLLKDRENVLDQEINLLKVQITSLSINKNANNVQQDELSKLRQKLDMVERIKNQQLFKEEEKNLYPKYLQGAHIVCTTLSSCIKLLQHTNYFDICIIDEATQCSEPWSLIPLQFGISSLVLVGDTQQLPATVLSKKTDQYGFGTSLFTRIQRCLENTKSKAVQSLRTQYRMHPEICQWPNSYFYKHFLCNGECTTAYTSVIKPYSILSLEFEQNQNVTNGQILNSLEALFIADLLVNMFKILPPRQFSYGIVTPYSEHREKLIKTCSDKGIKEVQIATIDSYQGKEKDIILISNGRTKGIGFLTNSQRLNVALTRARKCLILCGNFNNLERVPAWKSLLSDAKRRNIFYHINKSDALEVSHKVMPKILIKETGKN